MSSPAPAGEHAAYVTGRAEGLLQLAEDLEAMALIGGRDMRRAYGEAARMARDEARSPHRAAIRLPPGAGQAGCDVPAAATAAAEKAMILAWQTTGRMRLAVERAVRAAAPGILAAAREADR